MDLMSASLTEDGVAGIGMGILGKEPEPPLRTFFSSMACAFLSPAYLAEISFKDGPMPDLAGLWHEVQPLLLKSDSPSAANALAEMQIEAAVATRYRAFKMISSG